MGFIDRLRRAGGIVKNRLASAVGALRGAAAGTTVRGARTFRGVRFAARATRLLTPAGLGLTAVSFAPEIVRGVRAAGRFIAPALARGIAFFGGRQVVTAAGAGGVAGFLGTKGGRDRPVIHRDRPSGRVTRPSDFGDPRFQTRRPTARERAAPTARPRVSARRRRAAGRRRITPSRKRARRIPSHRHRVVSVSGRPRRRRKRATHRSPRHRGHKRVSFTTATGQKVSFLANPKARHR